jgi:hypothetical protein
MKYFLRVVALLLLSSVVFGIGGKTFTWQPPTQRMDGTALPQTEIREYKIYCDGDPAPVWTQENVPLNTDTWVAPDGTFALGTHVCFATTVDTTGQESDPSNTVNFTVTPERPNAPVFAVQ